EYTPYGELWTYKSKTAKLFLATYNNFLAKQPAGPIEETAPGIDKLPFRFTGKELDEETGLYYYGARYLDPKYSRWLSGDPALNDYIPKATVDDEAKKHNENLPGMGDVFNVVNLHVYHYAGNNPVKYTDPDGRQTAAIGLAKILSKIWAVAFAEPTPVGEVIAAAATVCILYLYFVDNAESSPTILERPGSVNTINPKTEFPVYDSNKTIDGFPETNKNNVHNTFPDTDRSTNIFEKYIPAPDSIPGIPDVKIAKRKTPMKKGGALRKRWKDDKGNIYERDSLHGELEKYNKRGIHQGVVDPNTGEQTETPKNDRKVES
uniref:colicin E3/pyocin S6 family cytotoxin n=1 Tax=Treponema pedis TaxID=409322 RepID=UPI000571ECE0